MKDYKLNTENHKLYLLESLTSEEKLHYIEFDSEDEAHRAKISLGLGTLENPIESPSSYRVLNRTLEGIVIYRLIESNMTLLNQQEEDISSCCYSGCTGCPIYAEKIKEED